MKICTIETSSVPPPPTEQVTLLEDTEQEEGTEEVSRAMPAAVGRVTTVVPAVIDEGPSLTTWGVNWGGGVLDKITPV